MTQSLKTLLDFGNYHLYQLNVLNASQNHFRTQTLSQTRNIELNASYYHHCASKVKWQSTHETIASHYLNNYHVKIHDANYQTANINFDWCCWRCFFNHYCCIKLKAVNKLLTTVMWCCCENIDFIKSFQNLNQTTSIFTAELNFRLVFVNSTINTVYSL